MGPATSCVKEGHEREESHQIVRGFQLPAVHVDGVTERLESVKGNADRQNDVERAGMPGNVKGRQDRLQGVDKKVEILEKPQYAQVDCNTQEQQQFSHAGSLHAIQV